MTAPIDYTNIALVGDQIPLVSSALAPGSDNYRTISVWITRFSRIIDNYCEMSFSLDTYPHANQEPYPVEIDPNGMITICTDVPIIQSISSISYMVPYVHHGVWQPVIMDSSITWANISNGSEIYIYNTRYSGYRDDTQISVNMTAGWSTITAAGAAPVATDLPNDFVEAMTELVAWAYNQRKSQTGQPATNPVTGQTIYTPGRWPPHIVAKFNSYKRGLKP